MFRSRELFRLWIVIVFVFTSSFTYSPRSQAQDGGASGAQESRDLQQGIAAEEDVSQASPEELKRMFAGLKEIFEGEESAEWKWRVPKTWGPSLAHHLDLKELSVTSFRFANSLVDAHAQNFNFMWWSTHFVETGVGFAAAPDTYGLSALLALPLIDPLFYVALVFYFPNTLGFRELVTASRKRTYHWLSLADRGVGPKLRSAIHSLRYGRGGVPPSTVYENLGESPLSFDHEQIILRKELIWKANKPLIQFSFRLERFQSPFLMFTVDKESRSLEHLEVVPDLSPSKAVYEQLIADFHWNVRLAIQQSLPEHNQGKPKWYFQEMVPIRVAEPNLGEQKELTGHRVQFKPATVPWRKKLGSFSSESKACWSLK